MSAKFLRRENHVIFSSDALTCGQKEKCWWHFQAMDVCEQALCLASVEMTLCDRLVSEGRLLLDTIFVWCLTVVKCA